MEAKRNPDLVVPARTWTDTLGQHLGIDHLEFGRNLVVGGSIEHVTDEAFASAANLLDPDDPTFDLGDFDPKRGQRFSSWESARHSLRGVESAIIKLPWPSKISGVVVDTKWHDGNEGQAAQLAASKDGKAWLPLTMPTPLSGHSIHVQRVNTPGEWNYVCLSMFPDGGIARLRLFEKVPLELGHLRLHNPNDPDEEGTLLTVRHPEEIVKAQRIPFIGPTPDTIRLTRALTKWDEPVNLASIKLGAKVIGKSDARYSHAENILKEEEPENMGDGWEMARFRLPLAQVLSDRYREIWDHAEWLIIELAEPGLVEKVKVDFRYYHFNNPDSLSVEACDLRGGGTLEGAEWKTLVPKMPTKQFASQTNVSLPVPQARVATHLRLKVYPCGGVHRIRAIGRAIMSP